MVTVRTLVASFVLAATLAVGVLLGLSSPAAAAEDTTTTPAYGETVALDASATLQVGVSAVAAVLGLGLVGYSLLPTRRARRARIRARGE